MSVYIVASDLSPRSDRAVARALMLAAAHDADLVLAHFDPRADPAAAQTLRARIARELAAAASGLRLDVRVIAAPPETGAPALAASLGASLLILGDHERHALRDLALFTTGERMLRAAPCPVLVAAAPPAAWRAGLAAVDFSTACEIAVIAASRLAPGMPIDAIHAVHVLGGGRGDHDGPRAAAIAEAKARMAAFDARPAMPPFRRTIVAEGGVRAAIRAAIRGDHGEGGHDLLILGAHGHSRLRDFALGSAAHDMARDPPCDLLIARD